ncbi:TPA: hypothetical protein PL548_001381 [Clostridium botulinum]|nr:hypothetical protein [Clostridium botulinum]
MWDNYIDNKLIMNSAREAEEYYFECIRGNINNKIKQACEEGKRSTDIKLPPNNIQQELKDIGYEIINTSQNTIIRW